MKTTDLYNVGDTITFYYNYAHPRYEATITKIDGDTVIVKALGDGQFYKLTADRINEYGKPNGSYR